jgi:hypothetical protein
MKPPRSSLAIFCALLLPVSAALALDPVSFEEISVRLKAGDTAAQIVPDVRHRQILKPFSAAQLSALKSLGASASLLAEVQRAENMAPPTVAQAVAARTAPAQPAVPATTAPSASAPPAPPALSYAEERRIESATRLIIEKIVIEREPFHVPFGALVEVSAATNHGQARESFHPPGRLYAMSGLNHAVEIPVNLTLKDVRESDWATLTVILDPDDALVTTDGARARHTTRIPITEKNLGGAGGLYRNDPPSVEVIASTNPSTEFSFRVYWHVR